MNPCVAADWQGAKCEHEHRRVEVAEGDLQYDYTECGVCEGTGRVPYNLAGFLWKPNGSLTAEPDSREIAICDGNIFSLYHNTKPEFIEGESLVDYRERVRPLLPSPELINQQPNPREVAIAALGRAGFRQRMTDCCITIESSEYGEIEICIHQGMPSDLIGECSLEMESLNPDSAQYAVDCFKVLKAWVDAIEWGDKVNWGQE